MIYPKDCWLKDSCGMACNDSFCLKEFKLDYLYNEANITMKQRKHVNLRIDSDGTDRTAFQTLGELENNILSFVQGGTNLFIHSYNCGNGKSAWALRLTQAYLNKIWPKCELTCKVLFISVPKFLLAIKDNINEVNEYAQHIKKYIYSADIVIWDDIATKSSTIFESENLFSMIDSRLSDNKSNIYTCNLSAEELADKLGDRLYSRIANTSIDIEFRGKDKRGLTI